MKRIVWIFAAALLLLVLAFLLVLPRKLAAYHFSEFENIKTNFNHFQPSWLDWLQGLTNNVAKWDYHLQKLVDLGVVQHQQFVFTGVPYTEQASRRIWFAANSNFPNAIMFTASWHNTNSPDYGVTPYVMDVWDAPKAMSQWQSFFESQNRKQ